jgi:hypothetical protein
MTRYATTLRRSQDAISSSTIYWNSYNASSRSYVARPTEATPALIVYAPRGQFLINGLASNAPLREPTLIVDPA